MASIDPELLATAAFRCNAYARALVTLEQLIVTRREAGVSEDSLQPYYDRLHVVYSSLEEPDGMEGITSKVANPSLEHQIREHESTGRWTAAQSCWEVKLQESPHDVDLHLGLLRCLRNLGHHGSSLRFLSFFNSVYKPVLFLLDTLLTHIKGILTTHSEWGLKFDSLQVEAAWMVGDWSTVAQIIQRSESSSPELALGKVLLAFHDQDSTRISTELKNARLVLGLPVTSSGRQSYRRSYSSIIQLHLVHELEMIHNADLTLTKRPNANKSSILTRLNQGLAIRFESTQPLFKAREPILSMRRTALNLRYDTSSML